MKTFEYNWATTEMVKMYLRNSRAQGVRKARMDAEASAGTQEDPIVDPEVSDGTQEDPIVGPGLATASGSAEADHSNVNSSDYDSLDEDE